MIALETDEVDGFTDVPHRSGKLV